MFGEDCQVVFGGVGGHGRVAGKAFELCFKEVSLEIAHYGA